jgi:hypothetical protein
LGSLLSEGIAQRCKGSNVTKLKFSGGIFSTGPTFLGIAMASVITLASPVAVIHELQRMRGLGYFVVDEAFEVVRDFESSDFAGLSVSSLAFMACERGHAEYKSRLRATGVLDSSGK